MSKDKGASGILARLFNPVVHMVVCVCVLSFYIIRNVL